MTDRMTHLLISHGPDMRPRVSLHATGHLNEIDRNRKVDLIAIRPEYQTLPLSAIEVLMRADIEKAIAAGIAQGKLVAPPSEAPNTGGQ